MRSICKREEGMHVLVNGRMNDCIDGRKMHAKH